MFRFLLNDNFTSVFGVDICCHNLMYLMIINYLWILKFKYLIWIFSVFVIFFRHGGGLLFAFAAHHDFTGAGQCCLGAVIFHCHRHIWKCPRWSGLYPSLSSSTSAGISSHHRSVRSRSNSSNMSVILHSDNTVFAVHGIKILKLVLRYIFWKQSLSWRTV